MITKRLEMIFQTAGGSRATIAVQDPLDTLTADQVKTVMDTIITKNVFQTRSGDLVGVIGARIVTREVNELPVA
ncbi:DUF2922 domain-containing protein [Calderihabitans maritimus]|uniref:DUF2922 domain-containing protein n=1 Tax=Calderihabitans maritimus TaxID=1246530 RepID=A0A1Z5HVZ5_9FIRM|nr:DUF2922 domain-containing protein [Calderihabitans maritimus]GAW93491.1 hypothetical protein Moth_1792 [Calderihabitans maritimus]